MRRKFDCDCDVRWWARQDKTRLYTLHNLPGPPPPDVNTSSLTATAGAQEKEQEEQESLEILESWGEEMLTVGRTVVWRGLTGLPLPSHYVITCAALLLPCQTVNSPPRLSGAPVFISLSTLLTTHTSSVSASSSSSSSSQQFSSFSLCKNWFFRNINKIERFMVA